MAGEKELEFYKSSGFLTGSETETQTTQSEETTQDGETTSEETTETGSTSTETTVEEQQPSDQSEVSAIETTGQESSTQETTTKEESEFEFKNETSKKFFDSLVEKNLSSVHDMLDGVYGWKKKSNDRLIADYLKSKYPDSTDEEIQLEIEEKGYRGLQPLTEEEKELLSEKEIATHEKELEKDALRLKKIAKEAKEYFSTVESQLEIELPDLLKAIQKQEKPQIDEGYKQYLAAQEEAVEAQNQQKEWETTVESQTAKIDELKISTEVTLDEGKLAFDVDFKLSDDKKKKLNEFLKSYIPTQGEVAAFTSNGQVDLAGFTEYVAREKVFSKEIRQVAIKEAIISERKKWLSELKNIKPESQPDGKVSGGQPWEVVAMGAGRK